MNSRELIKRNVGVKRGLILGMSAAGGLCLWLKVVAVISSFQCQKGASTSGSFCRS